MAAAPTPGLTLVLQLLTIMSSSIAYLTSRSNFLQVSPEIPVTKSRNADKYDPPDVLEGQTRARPRLLRLIGASCCSEQEGARVGLDCEGEAGRVLDPVAA